MIGDIPTVTFDTSAHNRLVKDGPLSEAILAGLKSGYHFRFAGLSLEEMASTPDTSQRLALFTYCGRLQDGSTDAIHPHYETLKLLILAHSQNPATFDWKTVNVRAVDFEREIGRRRFVWDDELSAEQRARQIQDQKDYRRLYTRLQPKLAKIIFDHGEALPVTLQEVITRLRASDNKLMLGTGKMLYDRAAGTDVSEATIMDFINVCPPFRALLYGTLISWYDLSIRDRHAGEKFQAGRNDMFMSVYLPYCDQFITAEERGEQEKCLREVINLAELETRVLSYDDFCDSLLVTV